MKKINNFKFIYNNIDLIDNKFLLSIKKKIIKKKISKFKICLHKNKNYPVQEMINFSYGFNYNRPHKHLSIVNESYHLIEGGMEIYMLDEKSEVIKKIKLHSDKKHGLPIIFKINKPIFHFVVPSTKWLVYHEVTTGPWKNELVKYAKFAPLGNNDNKGFEFYKVIKKKSKNLKWAKF